MVISADISSEKKWQIGVATTSRCNMGCKFCYSKTLRNREADLPAHVWKNFFNLNHPFIKSINYGTGENTLNDDWFEIVRYVRKKYPVIQQALTTNGYLTEKISGDTKLTDIVINSLDEVDVSIDFSEPRRHNEFRKNDHAFKWALKSLEFCKKFGLRPTIVFVGTNNVLEEKNIKGLFEIAGEFNCKLRMNIYRPVPKINEFSLRFIPDYSKIISTLFYIAEKHKILLLGDPLFSSMLSDNNTRMDPSGKNSLRILSNGSITPSTYLITGEFIVKNITEGLILDNISREAVFQRFSNSEIPLFCKEIKCRYLNNCCGGTLDRRFLWYGTLKEADPFCPFRKNNFQIEKKIKISANKEFTSIHDGYLPTFFFGV